MNYNKGTVRIKLKQNFKEEVIDMVSIAVKKGTSTYRIPKIMTLNHLGLHSPLPMIATLSELEKCLPGDTIVTHTDRLPEDLLDKLSEHGYAYNILHLADGTVKVKIYKN